MYRTGIVLGQIRRLAWPSGTGLIGGLDALVEWIKASLAVPAYLMSITHLQEKNGVRTMLRSGQSGKTLVSSLGNKEVLLIRDQRGSLPNLLNSVAFTGIKYQEHPALFDSGLGQSVLRPCTNENLQIMVHKMVLTYNAMSLS